MKKITKDFNNPPAILSHPNTAIQINASLSEKGNHDFKTTIYRHKDVLVALSSPALYNNKCAFCESDTTAGAPMQVEHYRPKAKVTNEPSPPGYYWLGYEWTNLLLACSSCNNKKRNHFPIDETGTRVLAHPEVNGQLNVLLSRADSQLLMGENALLINPEIETETRSYFTFHQDGTITGNNKKGTATISICGLNRDSLVTIRKKFYDDLFNKFMHHFADYKDGEITVNELNKLLIVRIKDLIEYLVDDGVYYEFAWTCWIKFPQFFINGFQQNEAQLLMNAYLQVQNMISSSE